MLERKSRKAFDTVFTKCVFLNFSLGLGGCKPAAPPPWVRQWSLLMLLVAAHVVSLMMRVVPTAIVIKYGGTCSKYSGS